MLKIQFFFIFVQTNIFFIQIFRKIFFFKLRKKKMKKRFRHFSHVITKFFIQNASEFHKKKKSFENFFHFTMFSSDVWIHCDIFFFDFWNVTFFFPLIFKIKSIFQHFFVFLKLVVALDFYYNVIAQQDFQTSYKKNRIASWSSFVKRFIESLCLYVKNSI